MGGKRNRFPRGYRPCASNAFQSWCRMRTAPGSVCNLDVLPLLASKTLPASLQHKARIFILSHFSLSFHITTPPSTRRCAGEWSLAWSKLGIAHDPDLSYL